MEKIFEQAKDLHVRNIVMYGKAADSKIYYESAYTTQVTEADLQDAFKKSALLVEYKGKLVAPVAVVDNVVSILVKTGDPTDEFSATATSYAVGDCVFHSGRAYKCKTQISAAAAWDATKWDEIKTVDFVELTAVAAD